MKIVILAVLGLGGAALAKQWPELQRYLNVKKM
jgi:hypothetical protein